MKLSRLVDHFRGATPMPETKACSAEELQELGVSNTEFGLSRIGPTRLSCVTTGEDSVIFLLKRTKV